MRGVRKCFPVLVSSRIKIGKISRGSIEINSNRVGTVKIGFGGVEGVPSSKGYIRIDDNARVVFSGRASFAQGSVILIGKGATVVYGDGFSAGKNFFQSCNGFNEFGNDVLIGWNVSIRDNDGHTILVNEQENPHTKPIIIGNHVWIGADALLLKGACVQNGSIIATKAVVTKRFEESCCIIGGFPANIIKKNVKWIK